MKYPNLQKLATLYHGSSSKIDTFEPRTDHGDPNVPAAVFATPYKAMALAYLGNRWGDRDINQGSQNWGNDWILQEMRPGAFDDAYKDKYGWLHELAEDGFERRPDSLGSDFEVISTEPVKTLRAKKIKDIIKALKASGVKLIPYGEDSERYEEAVARMKARLASMSEEGQKEYLNWVVETNSELAERLKDNNNTYANLQKLAQHTFVTGLSGSGKTTLAYQLAEELAPDDFVRRVSPFFSYHN